MTNELVGLKVTNGYGFQCDEMLISTVDDAWDFDVCVKINELFFTESDVRKLGYEPKDFVKLINQTEGENIKFNVDYKDEESSKILRSEKDYILTDFNTVNVMTDDFGTCIAESWNDKKMSDAYEKAFEIRDNAANEQAQNIEETLY